MKIQAKSIVPTKWGDANVMAFSDDLEDRMPLVVIQFGKVERHALVRLHSECMTGDVFGSLKCDCGEQLNRSLTMISEKGGILLYLRQEGRDIGLINKLKAYTLQESGADTIQANHQLGFATDARTYEDAVAVLNQLGIDSVDLITNNPDKIDALQSAGIEVKGRVPIIIPSNADNERYLKTKAKEMGHLFNPNG
jgi:3,4-dihydroxy 2-butanone 4-phosphate synthase/GTP cyclohydrolase II